MSRTEWKMAVARRYILMRLLRCFDQKSQSTVKWKPKLKSTKFCLVCPISTLFYLWSKSVEGNVVERACVLCRLHVVSSCMVHLELEKLWSLEPYPTRLECFCSWSTGPRLWASGLASRSRIYAMRLSLPRQRPRPSYTSTKLTRSLPNETRWVTKIRWVRVHWPLGAFQPADRKDNHCGKLRIPWYEKNFLSLAFEQEHV